ncbi:Chitinase A1 precursor [compost metagenome]
MSWSARADYLPVTCYEVYLADGYLATVCETHYRITGLTEKTEYEFKVRAKGVANHGLGDYFSAYTSKPFKTPAYSGKRICSAGNLRGIRTSATSAALSWDEPYATCTLCPNAVGYEIFGEGIAPINVIRSPCEVTGLGNDREYTLAVRVKATGNNVSLPAKVLIGRLPNPPGSLRFIDVTHSSATFAWTPPAGDVAVFDYLISCNGTYLQAVKALECTLSQLASETSYAIEVRARTNAGAQSDPVSGMFKTLRSKPVPPI